jgi:TonB family protein
MTRWNPAAVVVACALQAPLLQAADAPVVLEAVAPEYPDIALQARIAGPVPVDVEVGADGVPVSARAGSEGPKLLWAAAEAAARQWRFAPPAMSAEHVALTFAFVVREWTCDLPAERTVTFKPPYEVQVAVRPSVCCLPPEVTTKPKKRGSERD